MVILVLNCGSSSIKYQVIDMEAASSKLLAKGIVERIGLPEGDLTHKPVGKEPFELHRPIPDHTTISGVAEGTKVVTEATIGAMPDENMNREPGQGNGERSPFMPGPPGNNKKKSNK